MQNLASKGIDHTDRMVPHGADDRVFQPALIHQLAEQYALVDDMDLFTFRH